MHQEALRQFQTLKPDMGGQARELVFWRPYFSSLCFFISLYNNDVVFNPWFPFLGFDKRCYLEGKESLLESCSLFWQIVVCLKADFHKEKKKRVKMNPTCFEFQKIHFRGTCSPCMLNLKLHHINSDSYNYLIRSLFFIFEQNVFCRMSSMWRKCWGLGKHILSKISPLNLLQWVGPQWSL